ncbi:MAG: IS110 family transposase [Candidatus Cloacimonetes bacterium]|nr:IS110 family transposase [Candidatus Cloacimonadota bacterium]
MKNANLSSDSVKKKTEFSKLSLVNPNSAGIDIGSKEHWVCIAPHLVKENVRKFSAFTFGLRAISEWLKKCQVESVAMESTGVYWIPLYEILTAEGFDVVLCNAREAKNVPGRQKTDAKDCVWLQKLHSYGLLSASFVPPAEIRALQAMTRYRDVLVRENSRHVLRMQKSLNLMNILLPRVISNIAGKTGINIIKAIISGTTDPETLLSFKDKAVKASNELFLKALDGNYQKVHIGILSSELELYEDTCERIKHLDNNINEQLYHLAQINSSENNAVFNAPESCENSDEQTLIDLTGVDLTKVPGFNVLSIMKLIGETGTDMSNWKDARHFTSWLRLSPDNKISGGKVLSSRTIRYKPKAAYIFRICASTLGKNKSYLGYFLRKKKAQKGYPKALTATARKLATIYYLMLKNKMSFVELGEDYANSNNREKAIRSLRKTAEKFGFSLISKTNV